MRSFPVSANRQISLTVCFIAFSWRKRHLLRVKMLLAPIVVVKASAACGIVTARVARKSRS
ncbi:protein of unknown function [Methylocella tundrae]|uniref:Uncharacterized protein n=1 Tax=Methylocella tundrae TaxID=227605 RepID=A0A4U8Z179_METTU|nr:protein of unknown function [Methylocella tundrae]